MEFGVAGDEFSMKAWKVGDPEPPAPQLTVVDSTYAAGGIGVAATCSATSSKRCSSNCRKRSAPS